MQRYRCGDCGRRYQPGGAYHWPGPAVKERALQMYLDGSSLRAIGRVLGYSAPAVLGWVGEKRGRQALSLLWERNRRRTEGQAGCQSAPVIAWDEMWTYRGQAR